MKFIKDILELFLVPKVFAHCDIPCGIYDTHAMQMASHTVIRMTNMMNEVTASSDSAPFDERKKIIHQLARLTKVKEDHAEIVKREVSILWGDYFKEEHMKDYPDLNSLVNKILKLASKTKQEVNIDTVNELLGNVQQLAEIFYKSKGLTVVRVPSPYPTGGEIVSHT